MTTETTHVENPTRRSVTAEDALPMRALVSSIPDFQLSLSPGGFTAACERMAESLASTVEDAINVGMGRESDLF